MSRGRGSGSRLRRSVDAARPGRVRSARCASTRRAAGRGPTADLDGVARGEVNLPRSSSCSWRRRCSRCRSCRVTSTRTSCGSTAIRITTTRAWRRPRRTRRRPSSSPTTAARAPITSLRRTGGRWRRSTAPPPADRRATPSRRPTATSAARVRWRRRTGRRSGRSSARARPCAVPPRAPRSPTGNPAGASRRLARLLDPEFDAVTRRRVPDGRAASARDSPNQDPR